MKDNMRLFYLIIGATFSLLFLLLPAALNWQSGILINEAQAGTESWFIGMWGRCSIGTWAIPYNTDWCTKPYITVPPPPEQTSNPWCIQAATLFRDTLTYKIELVRLETDDEGIIYVLGPGGTQIYLTDDLNSCNCCNTYDNSYCPGRTSISQQICVDNDNTNNKNIDVTNYFPYNQNTTIILGLKDECGAGRHIRALFKVYKYDVLDIGLKVFYQGTIIPILVEPLGLSSVLRIAKQGTIYGIPLIDITDPTALPIRIKTPLGTKALRGSSIPFCGSFYPVPDDSGSYQCVGGEGFPQDPVPTNQCSP